MSRFVFIRQLDDSDNVSACVRMIARHYGKVLSYKFLMGLSGYAELKSIKSILKLSGQLGFRSRVHSVTYEELEERILLPVVVLWKRERFVVIVKVSQRKVVVSDPKFGVVSISRSDFIDGWALDDDNGICRGSCVDFSPTPVFENLSVGKDKFEFKTFYKYLRPHRSSIFQLVLGMLLGSVFSLIFPFLTKSVVDYGITNQDIDFIYLVLVANLVLLLSQTGAGFIRSWIMLHLTTRISVSLISDFYYKLLRLPMSFFDVKKIGDIMTRVSDHKRIQSYLMNSTLGMGGSLFNFFVFSGVMMSYNLKIFLVFIFGSGLNSLWIVIFLKKRRELDFRRFEQASANKNVTFQLIDGMQDIKLNNYEEKKMWEWEDIQAKLFKISEDGLKLSQMQSLGGTFISGATSAIVSILTAKAVIDGAMTLGMMMAVQYILGQLKAPLSNLIGFINHYQDSRISFERIAEIHDGEDEFSNHDDCIQHFPEDKTIEIKKISFTYNGSENEALKDIDLLIPSNKVTAIVGMSGSGKTTILKLLLGLYPPTSGEVRVGGVLMNQIDKQVLRERSGSVMHNSYIFADTVIENVTLGAKYDSKRFRSAIETANIASFIDGLPFGYMTKIGHGGHGLSQGQRQRLLISRAIYKNPDFLFFDEATNALDTKNESEIVANLEEFFFGKTVIVVAHRLSTIINADQIVVLKRGSVVECGDHDSLINKKGEYFQLVKMQMENKRKNLH